MRHENNKVRDLDPQGSSQGAARSPGVSVGKPPRISPADATHACQNLLGFDPAKIEYPGGSSRCSVRAVLGERSYIVTRRSYAARAALEAGVLRELRAAGAPVPAVLAFDDDWLIQEDLGRRRLSVALGAADAVDTAKWLERAASALLLCQRAGEKARLAQRVAPIGMKQEWLWSLLLLPGRIAEQLGLPHLDMGEAIRPAHLLPRRFSFVKWDSRPGNAILVGEAGLGWVDWEHCGARDALDDLAWLLCDEYVPDHPALEAELLNRFLPLFALQSNRTPEDALIYLSRFGSLHACMRLFLVLKHKGDGAWWDPAYCARTDRTGVTAEAARRLCARGARWAGRWPGGEPLSQFFLDAGRRLCDAPVESSMPRVNAALVERNSSVAHRIPH